MASCVNAILPGVPEQPEYPAHLGMPASDEMTDAYADGAVDEARAIVGAAIL